MIEADKVLATGTGNSGSWLIRGEQLARAAGFQVTPRAKIFKGYKAVILIKRPRADTLACAHASRVPIIYDIVDAWPQPDGNVWGREWSLDWLRGCLQQIRPSAVVVASTKMAGDVKQCMKREVPILVLPHHARPSQKLNPVREQIKVVGYEGSERHLGKWLAPLTKLCAEKGCQFIINPKELAELDVAVAMRESVGYAARNWKSNVKLVNAQATGTPCIVAREASYEEFSSGAEMWADTIDEARAALNELQDYGARRAKSAELTRVGSQLSLEAVAATYREWVCGLNF